MQTPTQTPMPRSDRRLFLAGIVGLGAAALVPGAARAELTLEDARRLIDQVVSEINEVINSGKSEEAMYRDFRRIMEKYADVPIVAQSALGVAWRRATPAQRAAYVEAFKDYISRKYGSRFRQFIGGAIEVRDTRKVKSFYEVITIARLRGEEPFEVRFLVSDKRGRPLFFNLIIEGVNMLATERTEIQAMLEQRRGNIDLLIQDLRKAA